jgi:hypothetical protein
MKTEIWFEILLKSFSSVFDLRGKSEKVEQRSKGDGDGVLVHVDGAVFVLNNRNNHKQQ